MTRHPKIVAVELIDEEFAERVAHIVGGESAFGRALAEIRRRREAGESLTLVRTRDKTLLIVPTADLRDAPPHVRAVT